jgi:hypothetical protein
MSRAVALVSCLCAQPAARLVPSRWQTPKAWYMNHVSMIYSDYSENRSDSTLQWAALWSFPWKVSVPHAYVVPLQRSRVRRSTLLRAATSRSTTATCPWRYHYTMLIWALSPGICDHPYMNDMHAFIGSWSSPQGLNAWNFQKFEWTFSDGAETCFSWARGIFSSGTHLPNFLTSCFHLASQWTPQTPQMADSCAGTDGTHGPSYAQELAAFRLQRIQVSVGGHCTIFRAVAVSLQFVILFRACLV